MRHTSILSLLIIASLTVAGCEGDARQNDVSGPGPITGTVQTLVDVTTGLDVTSGETGTFNWVGQSFIVRESGTFAELRFNFYTFQKTPVAFGNLYLLTQEHLGVPGGLHPSTPGLVARSEQTANGVYTFAPSVTITGGTKYWVYTDTQGSFASSFDTDIYADGDMYVTGVHINPFRKAPASGRMVNGVLQAAPAGVFVDANFRLQARADTNTPPKKSVSR
jgi:hypothetical protein